MYYLKTLGALSVHAEEPDGPALLENSKSLALLAYLAASSRRAARRDHLTDLFWPDSERRRARQSLRQALYYLHQKIGERLVTATDDEVSLRDELLDVDIWALDRALRNEEYERVVRLYRGPFLAPLRDRLSRPLETWVETRNERIWTGLKAALHQLVERHLARGDSRTAIHYAERYVRLNPLDESAREALIQALDAGGRPLEAIRSYESYRTLLDRELDDEPGATLKQLVEELRARVFASPETDPGGDRPAAGADVPAGGTPARRSDAGASGLDRPPPEHDPEDWRPLVTATVLLLALAAFTANLGPADDPTSVPRDDRYAALAVVDGEPGVLEFRRRGEPVAAPSPDLGRHRLPDPLERRFAVNRRAPRGINVDLEVAGEDAPRPLTRRPHDETALEWSPDGRQLVYQNGWLDDDGVAYRRRLRVVGVETGDDRRLADLPVTSQVRASWSPSGAWIAFDARSDAGDLDVWTVRPDGSDLRRLTPGGQRDAEPAWSPDGRWIAYAMGETGARSIVLTMPDDGRVIPLVDTGFDDHQPVWRSEARVLFLSTRGDETDVWEYDLSRDRRRRVTSRGDVSRLLQDPRRFAGARWIDTLRIARDLAAVAPGQWIRVQASGRGPDGSRVPVPERAVEWATSTPRTLERHEGTLFRVLRPGRVRIEARIPGWRSDTLSLPVRASVPRPCPLLMEEDWSRDPGPGEAWYGVGEPTPAVVEGDDRFPFALSPRGDEHYLSGLITHRAFSTAEGLTLEAWARVPVTSRHYQQIALGFEASPPEPGTHDWTGPPPDLRFSLAGNPDGPRVHATGVSGAFPIPDSLSTWRRYALQLHPDGRRSVALDGRVVWGVPPGEEGRPPDRVHAAVAGQTVGADIRIGPLRIYRGVRYVIP